MNYYEPFGILQLAFLSLISKMEFMMSEHFPNIPNGYVFIDFEKDLAH